jgi:hypothetical protein
LAAAAAGEAAGAAGNGKEKDPMIGRLTGFTFIAAAVLFAQAGAPKARTSASKTRPAAPKTFGTPEEARDALVKAAASGPDALKELFGPASEGALHTGDAVQDKNLIEKFKERVAQKAKLEPDPVAVNRMIVLVGDDEWPFAVPLMQKNGGWYFDVEEGKAELRRRRIGGNEIDAMEVCRGYVAAQLQYAEKDWNGNGVLEYASRLASTEGKKDGLYWPGEDSPVAASFAKATAEGYKLGSGAAKPYHGYYYKVLLGQGPNADGGARDYVVHGLMIGGFALVAWPAEYGVSGVQTFIVNQDGIVYEKDLGPQTAAAAKAMTKFNPDTTWQISPVVGFEEPESN